MNVKHSQVTDQHYTPPAVLAATRQALGSIIHLDPASSPEANALVGARRIMTEAEDGLSQEWRAPTVFLNPPGGMRNGSSNMQLWFNKLYDAHSRGHVEAAVFLGFQLSVLRLCPQIREAGLPFVIPSKRLAFWLTPTALERTALKDDGSVDTRKSAAIARHLERCDHVAGLVPSMSPPHDNIIIGLCSGRTSEARFYRAFESMGAVHHEYRARP